MKQGQIAWFILIGVLLLLAVLVIFFVARPHAAPKSPENDISGSFNDCLDQASDQAIQKVASQGGTSIEGTARWVKDSTPKYPANAEVEQAIEDEIESMILSCNPALPDEVSVVSKGSPKANVTIRNESVAVVLKYPITVRNGNGERTYDDFSTIRPSHLDEQLITGRYIADSYAKTRNEADITDSINRRLDITFQQIGGDINARIADPQFYEQNPTVLFFKLS